MTYVSSRTTPHNRPTKKSQVLNNTNIYQLSSFVCCERECTKFFLRDGALALWTVFYSCSTRMRYAKQLEIHGQLHALPEGSRNVVTLSNCDVCVKTWRYIFAISKTVFYWKRSELPRGTKWKIFFVTINEINIWYYFVIRLIYFVKYKMWLVVAIYTRFLSWCSCSASLIFFISHMYMWMTNAVYNQSLFQLSVKYGLFYALHKKEGWWSFCSF